MLQTKIPLHDSRSKRSQDCSAPDFSPSPAKCLHSFLTTVMALLVFAPWALAESAAAKWQPAGWGGGGFYYAAAFHPSKDGVLYLGGDVAGVYKSEDYGRNWRMINNGLAGYGVFTLAVDKSNPDTVYAATEDGLCKSADAGKSWQLLPRTGPKDLRITGEKNKSIRSVAVDPTDGKTVYAGSPAGKIFKSDDGGQTWKAVYEKTVTDNEPDRVRVQFGKVNGDYFGGFWMPVKFPESLTPESAAGLGFNFKGDGAPPKGSFVLLSTKDGLHYRSRDLREIFSGTETRNILLEAADFTIDPDFLKDKPEVAAAAPATPEWPKVTRIDISCTGPLPQEKCLASYGEFFFAGKSADRTPVLRSACDLPASKQISTYGNIRVGQPVAGPVYSVAVSPHSPHTVIAATEDAGLVISHDAGANWLELPTPKRASSVAFDPADPNVLYGTFFDDGLWKSTDQGKSWQHLEGSLPKEVTVREVAVSPANSQHVYVIGRIGWNGYLGFSKDGGTTWTKSSTVKPDRQANPTLPKSGSAISISIPTNITINPLHPEQLYVSANWTGAFSEDGGASWEERIKGADISCITDIRFSGDRTYVTAMDEGTLASDDQGQTWKQLWPLKYDSNLSGHNWRVAVAPVNGKDRLIVTASPWQGKIPSLVVLSENGGETFHVTTDGIPAYKIGANTMWERGFPRALAMDPTNPDIAYLGLDGDPTEGKTGGGVFKSVNGGQTWTQLPNQPASRRMYYGLAVDPTSPQRIYWAAFGKNGGVYLSEDGGNSWKYVFKDDQYLFNILVTCDGTVYASGKQVYRSTDHGKTWAKLTNIERNGSIVGLEVHPNDPNTLWVSSTVWRGSAAGGIFKTTDGGQTWSEITGNIPFVQPQILRFNPKTNELWAGFAGLYKIKQ